jgi:predicted RNase H-like HicB family nuclease
MKFTIAIEPGTKKSAFGIVVPDLPGCLSGGDTVEEAFDYAREIIDAFCQIMAEEGPGAAGAEVDERVAGVRAAEESMRKSG